MVIFSRTRQVTRIVHCFLNFCPLRLNLRSSLVTLTEVYYPVNSQMDSLCFKTMKTKAKTFVGSLIVCGIGTARLFNQKKKLRQAGRLLFKIKGCGVVCVPAKGLLPPLLILFWASLIPPVNTYNCLKLNHIRVCKVDLNAQR